LYPKNQKGADEMKADKARVIPLDPTKTGITRAIDTGEDSIFLWYSRGESWDRAPVMVDVGMHDDVDETIVMLGGEGYFLHGTTKETIVKSPWKAPCVLYMGAGVYHRIVVTNEGINTSVLMYTKAGAILEPFDKIIARQKTLKVDFPKLKEVPLS
jgi:hypothetical protein